MTTRNFVAAAAAVASLGALAAGCGYKGPLTLPEKTGPVVIRPAAPATPPQAAPVSPAPPAPEDDETRKPAPAASPGSVPATPPASKPEGSSTGG